MYKFSIAVPDSLQIETVDISQILSSEPSPTPLSPESGSNGTVKYVTDSLGPEGTHYQLKITLQDESYYLFDLYDYGYHTDSNSDTTPLAVFIHYQMFKKDRKESCVQQFFSTFISDDEDNEPKIKANLDDNDIITIEEEEDKVIPSITEAKNFIINQNGKGGLYHSHNLNTVANGLDNPIEFSVTVKKNRDGWMKYTLEDNGDKYQGPYIFDFILEEQTTTTRDALFQESNPRAIYLQFNLSSDSNYVFDSDTTLPSDIPGDDYKYLKGASIVGDYNNDIFTQLDNDDSTLNMAVIRSSDGENSSFVLRVAKNNNLNKRFNSPDPMSRIKRPPF